MGFVGGDVEVGVFRCGGGEREVEDGAIVGVVFCVGDVEEN